MVRDTYFNTPSATWLTRAICQMLNLQYDNVPNSRKLVITEGDISLLKLSTLSGRVRLVFDQSLSLDKLPVLLKGFVDIANAEKFPLVVLQPPATFFPTLRAFGFRQENRQKNIWSRNPS